MVVRLWEVSAEVRLSGAGNLVKNQPGKSGGRMSKRYNWDATRDTEKIKVNQSESNLIKAGKFVRDLKKELPAAVGGADRECPRRAGEWKDFAPVVLIKNGLGNSRLSPLPAIWTMKISMPVPSGRMFHSR